MKIKNGILIYPLLLGVLLMLIYSCKKENNNSSGHLPVLTTNNVTKISHYKATCGGNITSNGGLTITARGVCWNTDTNITIANSKTIDGGGDGSFTSIITGLSPTTIYYVRAYATNKIGTSYGNVLSFTTRQIDNIPPVITLVGEDTIFQDLHTSYTDPGATAIDNLNGDISSDIVVTGLPVNTDQCGETVIRYNVSDYADNPATELTRILKIKSDLLSGSYSVVETYKYTYNATVTQSPTVYNKLLINNFGSYGTSNTVEAFVNGTSITIPPQTVTALMDVYTIYGTGTYDGAQYKILTITYTETSFPPNSPIIYSGVYTKN